MWLPGGLQWTCRLLGVSESITRSVGGLWEAAAGNKDELDDRADSDGYKPGQKDSLSGTLVSASLLCYHNSESSEQRQRGRHLGARERERPRSWRRVDCLRLEREDSTPRQERPRNWKKNFGVEKGDLEA